MEPLIVRNENGAIIYAICGVEGCGRTTESSYLDETECGLFKLRVPLMLDNGGWNPLYEACGSCAIVDAWIAEGLFD